MRCVLPLLWACALAACTIDVDGAPCSVPGTTGDCPGGQACGNDGRCSARALACAGSRCTPGASDHCLDAAGAAPGDAQARRCVDADPVCGAWTAERCDDRGLLCGRGRGTALCECPPNATRRLVVLPSGGSPDAPPYANGAASPPACAFRTLTDALARGQELSRAATSLPVEVVAGGGRPYAAASGERFPLVVPDRVILRGGGGGGAPEILFDAGGAASAAIELRAGSVIENVTVRNGDGGRDARGIEVACGALQDPVHLASVAVHGAGSGASLGTGLHSAGACWVAAEGLAVAGAATGIVWEPVGLTSLALLGGSVTGCAGAGIEARSGVLILRSVRVADNGGRGVDGTSRTGALALDLRDSRIVRNGDTGLVVRDATQGLYLTGNTIWANQAATAWGGGLGSSGVTRRAGGIALAGRSPQRFQTVRRNRVYANAGDQIVLVASEATGWLLDTGICLDANDVGCFDPTPAGTVSYRGLVTIDVTGPDPVRAGNNWWGTDAPAGIASYVFPGGGDAQIVPACVGPAGGTLACAFEDPAP